jgi:hypothetical protein
MMLDKQLFESGMALMKAYPDDRRHPIIIEEEESIAALAHVLLTTMSTGVLTTPKELINFLNVILETCYCLGYQAGEDSIEINEVWYE